MVIYIKQAFVNLKDSSNIPPFSFLECKIGENGGRWQPWSTHKSPTPFRHMRMNQARSEEEE